VKELIAKEIAESLGKLTSTDFEWLSGEVVRGTILLHHKGVRDYTYPNGADGGVDWCFDTCSETTIVQSALYSTNKHILNKVDKEIIKMFEQPHEIEGVDWRYVFCVSSVLKRTLRSIIKEKFKELEKIPGYIPGSLEILDGNDFARIISSSDLFIERWGGLSSTLAKERLRVLGIEKWLNASASHSDKFHDFWLKSENNDLFQEEIEPLKHEIAYGNRTGRFTDRILHIVPSALNEMYLFEDLFCHYLTRTIVKNNFKRTDHSIIPKNVYIDAVESSVTSVLSILYAQYKKANDFFGRAMKFSLIVEYADLHSIPDNDIKHLRDLHKLECLFVVIRAKQLSGKILPAPIAERLELIGPIRGNAVLIEWKVLPQRASNEDILCTVIDSLLLAISRYDENESYNFFQLTIHKRKAFEDGLFSNLHPSITKNQNVVAYSYEMLQELRDYLLVDWMRGGKSSGYFNRMLNKSIKQRLCDPIIWALNSDAKVKEMPGGISIYPEGFSSFLSRKLPW